MINSILELSGVEASPVYLPRVDDVNGKGSWQSAGTPSYIVKHQGPVTTSLNASEAALLGEVEWHDSGTIEDGEIVWYDPTDTWAAWSNGGLWRITLVADVGSGTNNYFKQTEATDIITVTNGNATVNGVYNYSGIKNEKAYFTREDLARTLESNLYGTRWLFVWFGEVSSVASYADLPPKSAIWTTYGVIDLAYTTTTSDEYFGNNNYSGQVSIIRSFDSTPRWQVLQDGVAIEDVESSATYPPADFGNGVTTDLGQTITLDLQGGTGETTHYTFTTEYGTFPTITRESYIFAGWYTFPEGQGTRITADTELVVAEDATLYAKWVKNVSGKVGCGACLVSLFTLGIGTDIFCEYIGSRLAKTTPQTIIRKLPKP